MLFRSAGILCSWVSILVVLEAVLGVSILAAGGKSTKSFNPCCSGSRSGRAFDALQRKSSTGFNPCCSGSRSGSRIVISIGKTEPKFQSLLFWKPFWESVAVVPASCVGKVSILVVLEAVLGALIVSNLSSSFSVSILVVLEAVLGDFSYSCTIPAFLCFNPCCSGSRSGSRAPYL